MKVNDIVKGKVTGIETYGFFIKIDDYSGLVHISEISSDFVRDIHDFVILNEMIYVRVLEIDEEHHKLKLSIKDLNYRFENHEGTYDSPRGFLPLKEHLESWTKERIDSWEKDDENESL